MLAIIIYIDHNNDMYLWHRGMSILLCGDLGIGRIIFYFHGKMINAIISLMYKPWVVLAFLHIHVVPCTYYGAVNLLIVYIQHGVSAVDLITVADLCYLHFYGSRYPAIRDDIPYLFNMKSWFVHHAWLCTHYGYFTSCMVVIIGLTSATELTTRGIK